MLWVGSQKKINQINVGEFTTKTHWRDIMQGVEAVVHLAARAHTMGNTSEREELAYHQLNVEVTRRLVSEAISVDVKQFIFMSSIKVNGETTSGRAFTEKDVPKPEDAYGRTKWDAEQELIRATKNSNTKPVILRAPLVYGPGVKGNFFRLMEALAKEKILPLGMISNSRSLIYGGNLADAIKTALENPSSTAPTYLVRDGEDLSTTELCQRLAAALGVRARLPQIPTSLLRLGGTIIGQDAAIRRLTGSLQLTDNAIRDDLAWVPPFTVDQGLECTAAWFMSSNNMPKMLSSHDHAA
ncbi:MAG: hypothetical protein CBB68_14485 [Rhodospirillaceae bacterium TMED8]|nr:hypothetical protein [Magnetovibrio sp.]OUT47934.1 MAG: hypothetical protein CBB68_14485 [Rhodospirillaceae bacterium TMED8]